MINDQTNHLYCPLLLQLEQELARKLDDVEGQLGCFKEGII